MIRMLALACSAALSLLLITRAMQSHSAQSAMPHASPAAISPWSKDAPPVRNWHFVSTSGSSAAESGNYGPITVPRDATGHFRINAEINGQSGEFIIDTGADVVALTRDDAQRLGITVSQGDFRPILRTASGVADGAPVEIDRLSIGGTELHNVAAVVVDGLGTNLLGQSALRQLGKLEEDGDRMVIVPR